MMTSIIALSICLSVRHQSSSRHHFGLQIVQTSTRLIIRYGLFFSSEFTARKSKLWISCDSVSLRNGNACTSTWSTTQSESGVDIFALVWLRKAVISNSHCRNTVEHPTKSVMLYMTDNFCVNNDFLKFSCDFHKNILVISACSLAVLRPSILARLTENS